MNHKKWTFMDGCTIRLSMGWVKIWKKLLLRITHSTSSFQELLVELKTNKQKWTTENSGHISSILNFCSLIKKLFCNFMVFQMNCQLIGGCMLLIVIARQLFLNRFSPLVPNCSLCLLRMRRMLIARMVMIFYEWEWMRMVIILYEWKWEWERMVMTL